MASYTTLAHHFKAAHNITCGEYRVLYPGAPIRGGDHPFRPKLDEAPRLRGKRGSRFEGLRLDDEGKIILDGLLEGYHYVHCASCGYPAEDLTEHILSTHPEGLESYKEVFPESPIVCKRLELLAQKGLKGRSLSSEVRAKMSANAGRWNKGLTKETDARMANISEKRMGQPSWSKGLTKADHPSLQSTSEKLSALKTGQPCTNGLKADLSQVDFTPYLDETGAVDRKTMAEELGLCEPTVTKYMESLGLRLSNKYVDARAERQVVRLEKDALLPFALANGKVVIGAAMAGLGRDFKVIKRECQRHGLATFTHRVRQSLCLGAISKALGGASYEQEWRSRQFCNPLTGHVFRFDGFFREYDLLVEFQGWQHWVFPSVYVKTRELFDALVERDRQKALQVEADGRFKLFLVREDEPYTDPAYLRGRLIDEGFLDP